MSLQNHKTNKKEKGFTILELLVVIGIIAVLITAGTVSYSTSQKVARDARRLQDLNDMRNAFEQYYSICNNLYGVTVTGDLVAGDTLRCILNNVTTDLITYPADPLGGNYQCVGSCTVTSYTVCPRVIDPINQTYLETKNCNSTNRACCPKNQQ